MHMKYAVLSYDRKALSLNGRDGQNLGDWIQTLAVEELYKEFGIEEYSFVSRNDAASYKGDEVCLLVNGYHTLINRVGYKTNTFPLSENIYPIFLSMHFHDRNIPIQMQEQLRKFGPVGCRDEETFLNMQEHGIPAFLSGCVTALFARRVDNTANQNEVLLVDIPKELAEKIPEKMRKDAKSITQIFPITRQNGNEFMTESETVLAYEKAKELLRYYKEHAKLVITSRLHTAVPCMAMGIPVILAKEDFDGRFSWIDKYLPLYSKDKWDEIDWNPVAVEFEDDKKKLKDCYREFIFSNPEKRNTWAYDFWGQRERYFYNKIIKTEIERLKERCSPSEQYFIWGVTDNTLRLNNVIKELFPQWKLVGVYDRMVRGKFEGYDIVPIEELSYSDDSICFVAAPKAWEQAKETFKNNRVRYILVDFNDVNWTMRL